MKNEKPLNLQCFLRTAVGKEGKIFHTILN